MVTCPELTTGLKALCRERRDLASLLDMRYRRGMATRRIAELLHHAPLTVAKEIDAGLDFLAARLWR
jgi:hypothetical protein